MPLDVFVQFPSFTKNLKSHMIPSLDLEGIAEDKKDEYVEFMEAGVLERYGTYNVREHDARMSSVERFSCVNCIFDFLGVPYHDWDDPRNTDPAISSSDKSTNVERWGQVGGAVAGALSLPADVELEGAVL